MQPKVNFQKESVRDRVINYSSVAVMHSSTHVIFAG
jgi:hypothetical protein